MASGETGIRTIDDDDEVWRQRVLAILQQGRAGTTMCPSDVARRIDPNDWRALMSRVREAACALADAGLAEVTQRGQVVEGRRARGAIRLRATGR